MLKRLTFGSCYLLCFTQHYLQRTAAFTSISSQSAILSHQRRSFSSSSLPFIRSTTRSTKHLHNNFLVSTTRKLTTKSILIMSAFDLNSVTESASTSATTYPYPNQGFVDVHAHLLHEKFAGKEHEVVQGCLAAGLDHVIINGLEPVSNRQILDFCEQYYPIHMLPAMGIYPLDAACNFIYSQEDVDRIKQERSDSDHNQNNETSAQPLPEVNWKHDFPPPTRFDVDAEIDFIEEMVKTKRIVALGECGLDKHYLTDEVSFAEQVRVLRKLMKIAAKYDIPIILHTRKAEKKVFDMLIEENVKKADFHCYCGKLKLGLEIAEAGYYLSIPSAVANTDPNSSFKKLAAGMRLDRLLTETDSPYMGPVKGEHNTPATVPQAVDAIAKLRNMDAVELKNVIRQNFRELFNL